MASPPSLPDDVISEILSRTPVKSLCRFRCVSKEWHALISDPAFAAAHRCPELLLVATATSCNERTGMEEIKVMDMDGNVLRVMDADSYALEGSPYVDTSSGQVVDLATGQVIAACPPELRKIVRYSFTIGRAAAPSCAYKAVSISYSRPYIYMVLTLGEEDAKWRPVPLPPPPYDGSIGCSWSSFVTLNGVVYFLLYKDTPPQIDNGAIVCFDLESETWNETINGPPVAIPPDIGRARITILNDALCMIVILLQYPEPEVHDDDDRARTEVWILSDHGGAGGTSWTKAYSIPIDPHIIFDTPLRVMTRDGDGRKQLLSCWYDCRHSTAPVPVPVLRLYDPLGAAGETYTEAATKLPGDLLSVTGVYDLHLKHALSNSI